MATIAESKVLVVDDEQDVRNYLKTALEDAGFLVRTATDGDDALEKVKSEVPDLISLDLVMPKRSGIEFYREIQKNSEFKKIPILIVTGHAHDDLGKVDFEALTMQGPGVYLEKPVKPRQYVESICKILGIEPPESAAMPRGGNADNLKEELRKSMDDADPDALQKALDALKKN